jgi:MFS transporter, DHA2 family, multidrug resistance protein
MPVLEHPVAAEPARTVALSAPPSITPGPAVNPWIIALTVMLATFMEVLDTSVANVSLPHIAGNLAASLDESTWVLTAYLVSNAIVLPLAGWFSTLFGRKRFYMFCVATFTVASCLCGFAPSLEALVVFRILQGLGGGALQPISQAILVESFPKKKHGMAMAVYGMGVVLAPIIGPTLGGWLTDSYSWRWIFFINVPVGVLSLTLTTLLIFDPPYLERRTFGKFRMDYMGLGLIATGLGFLEVFLDEGQRKDWFSSPLIVVSAAVAGACLAAAVVWEIRHEDPVVELRLLRDRRFAIATFTMFGLGFVLYGSTVLLPIFLQTLMGYDALTSGLALSPGGVAVVLLMPLVGLLLSRFEPRWLVAFGLAVSALGLFQMAGFNTQIDFRTAATARIVQSIGMAFLFVPINTAAFSSIAKEKANRATGIINLARNIGGSTGIAIVTTMLARRAQFHQSVLVSHAAAAHSAYRDLLENAAHRFLAQGSSPTHAARQAQALIYTVIQREATVKAFIDDFWLLGVIFLAMIPVVLFMRTTVGGKPALVK